jgi:hypothetical protein
MSFPTLLYVRKEEKSVRQFLSNIITCPVVCSKESILPGTQGLRTHARGFAAIMTGFVASLLTASYLTHEHPLLASLSSLLNGFAPLIGSCVLLIIVALLLSFLICTAERTLAINDDGVLPKRHAKSKWYRVASCLTDQLTYCLSLKEHSPPTFLVS